MHESLQARELMAGDLQQSFHNFEKSLDVNADAYVTALDALLVVNDLNARGSRDLRTGPAPDASVDVNNDGMVSPADALLVIEGLAKESGEPERYIINGTETNGYESVGIVIGASTPEGHCTATLISPSHALTAAHCQTSGPMKFGVGGREYDVRRFESHPHYQPQGEEVVLYDIAIMELEQEVAGISPSQLLRRQPQLGEELTLVGFGWGGESSPGWWPFPGQRDQSFGTKREGTASVERIDETRLYWTMDSRLESKTAPGDSGGPAFILENNRLVVAGVTSGGSSGPIHGPWQNGTEAIDTRVDVFIEWIDGVLNNGGNHPGVPQLQNLAVEFNSLPTVIDLTSHFNGSIANLSVASSTPAVVGANIDGTSLVLNYGQNASGKVTITLSSSNAVVATFEVTLMPKFLAADFDANGTDDLLAFGNGNWYSTAVAQVVGSLPRASEWRDLSTGDFNGDGRSDVVGRLDGQWWVGLSNGSSLEMNYWGYWADVHNWSSIEVQDFNGDGKDDIIGRTSVGEWWVAESTGSAFASSYWGYWNPSQGWENIAFGDFNGDHQTDIAGQIDGHWWIGLSTGSGFETDFWTYWGGTWTDLSVGDFNGDGRDDIAGRNGAGQWWGGVSSLQNSFDNEYWATWSPHSEWLNVEVGDFNGDGKDDLVARNDQTWWGINGGRTDSSSTRAVWEGEDWLAPSVGDFNGDQTSDLLAFRRDGSGWDSIYS